MPLHSVPTTLSRSQRPSPCRFEWAVRLLPVLLLGCIGCRSLAGKHVSLGARVSTVVVESFDSVRRGSSPLLPDSPSYSSVEFAPMYVIREHGGQKILTGELVLGRAKLGGLDTLEAGCGGRLMLSPLLPEGLPVRPFVAMHALVSVYDDVRQISPGYQLSARTGAGVEVPIRDSGMYLDFVVDYTSPLRRAEGDDPGATRTEFEGLALRVGIGWSF